ncbi:hypothetical protein [Nocardia sp. NPDC004750]
MNIEAAIPVVDKFGDLVVAVADELARRQDSDEGTIGVERDPQLWCRGCATA